MNEAVPHAAEGMTAADIEHALGVLEMVWGDEYEFGYDPEKGFWATRHGQIGALFTAHDPEELGNMLADEAGKGQ